MPQSEGKCVNHLIVVVTNTERMTARQRRMSFANRRHLSVPDPRAAISSLELGSSQEEGPPTPSILVLSPQQATGSDDGNFQSVGDRSSKPGNLAKIGRYKNAKLSGY